MAGATRQTGGERFEQSTAGRIVLSAVMLLLIVSVALWNLPPGKPRDATRPVSGRVLHPLGLEQDWALFAPDPRAFSVGLYAEVTHQDGRTVRWTPPHNGHWFTPYATYRWQKYVERVRADDYANLWAPTARWVARQGGSDVTKVVLVRTFRDTVLPGSGKVRPQTGAYPFYTLTLPGGAP